MTTPDVAMIVTGHHEGLLAHPTLRSLRRAIDEAAESGLSTEVLLVLDNGDDATRKVFQDACAPGGLLAELPAGGTARCLEVSVKDPGLARNAGVEASSAAYVGVLDADNLISPNWLTEAVALARQQSGLWVIHPECLITFEARLEIWPQVASDSEAFNADNFFDRTYWDTFCLASREVFVAHPYLPTSGESGFGPEDWHWGIETFNAGIPHLSCPDTALFYRLKKFGSVQQNHDLHRSLLAPTALLTDPARAAAAAPRAARWRQRRTPRRIPLLHSLVREAKGRAPARPLPPDGLSTTQRVAARANPRYLHLPHYRFANPDLAHLTDEQLTTHWEDHGHQEGRRGWLNNGELADLHPATFRVEHYRALHSRSIFKADWDAIVDWLDHGRHHDFAGRLTQHQLACLVDLDLDDYRSLYDDISEHNDLALVQHYLEYGISDGRRSWLPAEERGRRHPSISDGVLAQWREMPTYEPWIPMPGEQALKKLRRIGAAQDGSLTAGSATWWQLVNQLGGVAPDVVILAPWLRMGGADLLVARYAQAIQELRPHSSVLVVTTHGLSTRPELLGDIPMVDLFSLRGYRKLSNAERARLVGTFLVQFAPHTVHMFNSVEGFNALQFHARAITAQSHVFLSTYVMDHSPEGDWHNHLLRRPVGFLDPVEAVITDNHAFIDQMHDLYGIDRAKFVVQHQPMPLSDHPVAITRAPGSTLRVLWAGRFDQQKRPDILAEVIRRARARGLDIEWHVHGAAVLTGNTPAAALADIAELGIAVQPPYASTADLDFEAYDAYLLTSENEGVPVAVLEMMSHGLPVVAPLVGGLGEIVTPETGWPVPQFEDIDAYVDVLTDLAARPEEAAARAARARARLQSDFSPEAFKQRLAATPHYLPPEAGSIS